MWRRMFGSAWAMQQFICSRNIHFLREFLVLSISGCVCLVVAVLLYGHLDQTFRAWIILWLVWAPLTSSGQRRHFASRAREYVVKYYTRNWGYCNNQRLKDGVVTSETKSISNDLFLENISNNWIWIQFVQFFFLLLARKLIWKPEVPCTMSFPPPPQLRMKVQF